MIKEGKMKLYYRNHKHADPLWLSANNEIQRFFTDEQTITIDNSNDKSIAGHECILFHSPNMLEKFRKAADNSQYDGSEQNHRFDDKCIVFFMSSEALSYPPSRATYSTNGAKHTAYVFYIKKNGRNVSQDEWKLLFDWAFKLSEDLRGSSNEIPIENIINEMPSSVKEILCGTSKSYVSALAILCQGYIASHGGEIENGIFLSGWDKLSGQMKEAIKDKWGTTEKSEWWSCVLGEGNRDKMMNEINELNLEGGVQFVEMLSNDAMSGLIKLETVRIVYKECRKILQPAANK